MTDKVIVLGALVAAFGFGVKFRSAVLGWLNLYRWTRWIAGLLTALVLVAPLAGQTRDSIVCTGCVVTDSTVTRDSVPATWAYTTRVIYTYRDSVIPVPVPPPTSGAPPAGFRLVSAQDCRSAGWAGTGTGWFWRTVFVVNDSTGPVCEWRYPKGYPGGTGPGSVWLDEAALRTQRLTEVWMTGRLWVSPNWDGHTSLVNKTLFVGFGLNGNQFYLNLRGSNAATLFGTIEFQGMGAVVGTGSCGVSGLCTGRVQGRAFPRGRWVQVTLQFSATAVTLWQDGVQSATASGLNWRAVNFYLAKAALNPTWGGQGDQLLAPQQLRWDQIEVWGR